VVVVVVVVIVVVVATNVFLFLWIHDRSQGGFKTVSSKIFVTLNY